MTSSEIPSSFPEERIVYEAIDELKRAMSYIGGPLDWYSSDSLYHYVAKPLDDTPDYATVGDMPIWQFTEKFNAWQLIRVSKPDINGDTAMVDFRVIAGLTLRSTRYEIPLEIAEEDEDSPALTELLQSELDTQTALGVNEVELIDYALLDNALSDLKVKSVQAFEERVRAWDNMTEDEIRWERMQKFSWLRTPEMDKTDPPKWWGFTEGSQVHIVYASTPDEAVIILEDYCERPIFPIFFVDPYDEEGQKTLQDRHEGKSVVRLIPFSAIEWPEDPKDMTSEQIAAFDRLKSSSGQTEQ